MIKKGVTIKGSLLLPLIFALFGLSAGLADVKNKDGAAVPEIKRNCKLCHPPEYPGKSGTSLLKPLSNLCIDCHPERKAPAEHKVDVVPSMTVLRLPLSQGRMTCVTCHDPHANPYGKLLRLPAKSLCFECHKR